MEEQPPEAWVDQEVIVHYGYGVAQSGIGSSQRASGILKNVGDRGVVVSKTQSDGTEQTAFYPYSSIAQIVQGPPPQTKTSSMRIIR